MRRCAAALALVVVLVSLYAGALCFGRWLGGVLAQYVARQYSGLR
jgi:hypothetical protein